MVVIVLEFVIVMINYFCELNVFVFLEKGEICVWLLRKIVVGEEIIICYIDFMIDVKSWWEILMDEYFFECDCKF